MSEPRIDKAMREKKVAKLVSVMMSEGLDGLLLNRIENVRYSTDLSPVVSMWFQNSYSSFVSASGDVVLLTVAGDYMHSKHYLRWIGDMRVMHAAGRAEEVSAVFRDYNAHRVGYDSLGYEERTALEQEAHGVSLVNAGERIAEERAVKLADEVKIMDDASRATEAAIRAALKCAKPGMREYEIAAEAEFAARKMGAEGMSWSLATFSGVNTGLMLRHASSKVVRAGEFLILGYATIYRAYNTDITTTTIVGRPSSAQKAVYTATYDSFIAALNKVRPGVTTLALHDEAERVILERGYKKYTFSQLQPVLHGVGLNVYEPPWSPEPGRRHPSMKLKAGHVLAIEPSITVFDDPKVGGCRIGETLVVTDNGYRLLTHGKPPAHDLLYQG